MYLFFVTGYWSIISQTKHAKAKPFDIYHQFLVQKGTNWIRTSRPHKGAAY